MTRTKERPRQARNDKNNESENKNRKSDKKNSESDKKSIKER
jgi:hypothetical protein